MEDEGDRELLRRLAGGDKDALSPLMDRHYRRLYRILLSYVRNEDEALDGVQEVFVKAYRHAARWDGGSEPGAWLTRIAVNEAIDRYRRRKRWSASFRPLGEVVEPPAEGGRSDDGVRAREIGEQIGSALDTLAEKERSVFVLRHLQEMTLEEIAQALALPLGTVKSSLHRAVHRLREQLSGWRA
jgi:RNA polymerase sigma-70 factor, ECF subfamily